MTVRQELEDRREVRNLVGKVGGFVQLQLETRLRRHSWFSSQANFSCEFRDGVVVLRGHVGSYHQKQMAQEVARRVDGVRIVVNRLVVDASGVSEFLHEAILSDRQSQQPVRQL